MWGEGESKEYGRGSDDVPEAEVGGVEVDGLACWTPWSASPPTCCDIEANVAAELAEEGPAWEGRDGAADGNGLDEDSCAI